MPRRCGRIAIAASCLKLCSTRRGVWLHEVRFRVTIFVRQNLDYGAHFLCRECSVGFFFEPNVQCGIATGNRP